MDKKKFISQVVAAVILYIVISVILEKDYSQETIIKESKEGLVFGVVFGVVMWLWALYKKRK